MKIIDLLVILLLLLSLPLFFYKLGQSSLVSFDEAWYVEIARNIIKTGNPLQLVWNGEFYRDHPPAGFWWIALSMRLLGESEFAVRAPSAIFGFLTLLVLYFLGKELFGRIVGICSALATASSFWFLFRARSGNLDVTLTFFFVLTIFLALKYIKDKKFLLPFSFSLTLLLLTKTLIPFTIFAPLLVIFWKKVRLEDIIKIFSLPMIVFLSWVFLQLEKDPKFINRFLQIGLPGVKFETLYFENLNLMKEYLHSGIGKWFWPGIFSIFVSLILHQRRFLILTIFFLTFFLPFLFSNKGHIWHLIPLHPIMILSFFGFSYVVLKKFIHQIFLVNILIISVAVYVALFQMRIAWNQFINIPAFVSDEEILSEEASKYSEPFFIDGDFEQTAVYYSKKNVKKISREELAGLFESKNSFLLITYQWRLDETKISENRYQILKQDRDKILIKSI